MKYTLIAALLLSTLTIVHARDLNSFPRKIFAPTGQQFYFPPADISQFLENIYYAVSNDVFIQDDFITESSLTKFTNSKKIERLEGNPDFVMISDSPIKDVLDMAVIRNRQEDKGAISLSISFHTKKIGMDYLFKKFGPPAYVEEIYAKYNSTHPAMTEPTTHIMGNMETRHFFHAQKSNTEIIILFAGNGSIARMNIRQTVGGPKNSDDTPLSEQANMMLENARRDGLSYHGYNALVFASRRSSLLSGMLNEAAKRMIRISMAKAGEGSYFQSPTLFIDPKLVPGAVTGLVPGTFAVMIGHHLSHALQENPSEVLKKTAPTSRENVLNRPLDMSKLPVSEE